MQLDVTDEAAIGTAVAATAARFGPIDVLVNNVGYGLFGPIEGVTAQALAARMREFGHRDVVYALSNGAGVDEIVHGVESGDLIVTLGAGSVSQLAEKILEGLKLNAQAA